MDGSVLHVALTEGDVAALLNAADRIYSFIGYAQGEEARYQMQRDQIVVVFPDSKKKPPSRNPADRRYIEERKQVRKKLQRWHQVSFKRRSPRCQKKCKKKSNELF